MYDFYETMYKFKCLELEDLKKACKYDVITKEEFKEITNQKYTE